MLEGQTIALIGAGVMAEVLATGLIRSKLVNPQDLIVSHHRPERLAELAEMIPGIRTTGDNGEASASANAVVLCVRPQAVTEILGEIASAARVPLFMSIAAGVPISTYERSLGDQTAIIRAMPTFFGRIRQGTTGLALNSATSAADLAIASRLFSTISANVIVLQESEMDAFTTFGSTTTAAVYLLLDALITAGSLVGMRHQASHSRAIEQVVAAANNVASTDKLPSQLLDELCTPGGVTVEGVKVLEERATRGAVIDGVLAANQRAMELRRQSERDIEA